MSVTIDAVAESPSGHHLHLLLGEKIACGASPGGWQLVIGRRLREAPMCKRCLSAVRRLASLEKAVP